MAQTLHRILVHVVFSTKDRAPLLKEPIRPRLFAYLVAASRLPSPDEQGSVRFSPRARALTGTALFGAHVLARVVSRESSRPDGSPSTLGCRTSPHRAAGR